ncbi:unnamed protein product, partial [Rotaria sordida]
RDNKFSESFKKRIDATCFYFLCVIDGDDLAAAIHFHDLGADGYYHAHHDLCLCTDNVHN